MIFFFQRKNEIIKIIKKLKITGRTNLRIPLFSIIVFSSKNIDKTGAKKTSPGYLNQIESNILIEKLKLKIT